MVYQKGESGNLAGRPKKSNDFKAEFLQRVSKRYNDQKSVLERAIDGIQDIIDKEKGWLKADACKWVIEHCIGKAPVSGTEKNDKVSLSFVELVNKATNERLTKKTITGTPEQLQAANKEFVEPESIIEDTSEE